MSTSRSSDPARLGPNGRALEDVAAAVEGWTDDQWTAALEATRQTLGKTTAALDKVLYVNSASRSSAVEALMNDLLTPQAQFDRVRALARPFFPTNARFMLLGVGRAFASAELLTDAELDLLTAGVQAAGVDVYALLGRERSGE